MRGSRIVLGLYIVFLLVPIYWLVIMSLKSNTSLLSQRFSPMAVMQGP